MQVPSVLFSRRNFFSTDPRYYPVIQLLIIIVSTPAPLESGGRGSSFRVSIKYTEVVWEKKDANLFTLCL
jgi:hypothetical protein